MMSFKGIDAILYTVRGVAYVYNVRNIVLVTLAVTMSLIPVCAS
jgi:hypothetical protein